ncbi:hypothetical protein [Salinibacter grassmerensis]|uniref:hypothetical protein n=1 Tax=Salinibacter grassmerensis TaxID=3040353 RepID=UPI0021E7CD50|nr:hypothetical protein [Salinibacter grassmerensis]
MSTDLRKKLGTSTSLIGSALMLAATLMTIGVPPFSASGFEDIAPFVILSGGFLIFSGGMFDAAGQFMRQRTSQCSEEDVEAG